MNQPVGTADFAQGPSDGIPPLSNSKLYGQSADVNRGSVQGSTTLGKNDLQRADSTMSQSHTLTPSRGGTLKKRQSLSRKNSLNRNTSKKGSRPNSVKSLKFADDVGGHGSEMNSAFFTPVPTSGSPTEVLANRFQVWRKVLKDLITYFRDIQKSYDSRSKSLYTLSNVVSNITTPSQFIPQGGISDAVDILRDYHKQSIAEGSKAKSIEEDVIVQLTGLRSDLGQKIKEIKGLSGDFKNNVDKETEGTRRAVRELQDALGSPSTDAKSDPFLVRLAVDRQLGRQIEEENYLHRAFLNLESSGRELESIVMGEIQKAYKAYAAILKKEADEAYDAVEKLRVGPLALSKDHEWNAFVDKNEHFVDPRIPVRRLHNITYPGKDEAAAMEVKAGMLERKSKYLKSYTPGWYVLSTTHLHEFKSPDRIASQTQVMSLALVDQKLGSRSSTDSTSHKFMLKGRQSGGMHRGHAWVFRAESYDTMLAWYNDIKSLTEKTGAERDAFIQRSHARSVSAGSNRAGSVSSDGMEEDEADEVPYSAAASQRENEQEQFPQRPNPGGRFPSQFSVDNRNSQVPLSTSSNESSGDHRITTAAGPLPEADVQANHDEFNVTGRESESTSTALQRDHAYLSKSRQQDYNSIALPPPSRLDTTSGERSSSSPSQAHGPDSRGLGGVAHFKQHASSSQPLAHPLERHDSNYGDWMGATAIGSGSKEGEAYRNRPDQRIAATREEQAGLEAVEHLFSSAAEAFPESSEKPTTGTEYGAVPPPISPTDGVALTADGGTSRLTERPHLDDPAEPTRNSADRPERPSLGQRVDTISDLHLPGEFPRSKQVADPS